MSAPLTEPGTARSALRRMPVPLVLFTGGKGGVGKTTLAANLGVLLARQRRRVLLLDLDLGLANLNVFLRLSPRRNVEDALSGESRLEECVVAGPAGVHVLPAGNGTADMARPDEERRGRLLDGIARIAPAYDLLIGDSAAGIGPDVLAFATAADHVLVVTTPEPPAVTDAYGTIKALDTFSQEHGADVATPELFVNLAGGVEEAEATALRLRRVCERFLARSPRLAGWLPRTRSVQEACERQEPFVLAARNPLENGCLRRLGARIQRLFPPGSGTQAPAGARR